MKKKILVVLALLMVLGTGVFAQEISGTIEVIDLLNKRLSLRDWDNDIYTIDIPEETNIKNLYYDQEVLALVEGGKTLRLDLIEEEDPERNGYISFGTRFQKGTVLSISKEEIKIKSKDKVLTYGLDPFTIFSKKQGPASLNSLKEGDRVILLFDDIYTRTVAEVKIEDQSRHIAGVMKGKIEVVDERNKEVLIDSPYILNKGQWVKSVDKTRLKLASGDIYNGSKKISLKDLKKLRSREVYVAYENAYGRQNIGKMLVKSGSAMEYRDQLDDIDYGSGSLWAGRNLFSLSKGTIVIKDDRLVDPLNLDKDQKIFLISDFVNGEKLASLVSIEGQGPLGERNDGTRLIIQRGKIEDILDYTLVLGNNYKIDKMDLTEGGFVKNPKREAMFFTEDSLIFDGELGKEIPVKAFLDSSHIDLIDIRDRELRKRLEDDFYKNKPAYVVAVETPYGKEILGLNLSPIEDRDYGSDIDLNFTTRGLVTEVGQDSLSLGQVQNYNTLSKTWDYTGDERIDLKNTLVIKGDRGLRPNDGNQVLKGDRVFLVRYKEKSRPKNHILIVE